MKNKSSIYGISGGFVAGLLVAGLLVPLTMASKDSVEVAQVGTSAGSFGTAGANQPLAPANGVGANPTGPGAAPDPGNTGVSASPSPGAGTGQSAPGGGNSSAPVATTPGAGPQTPATTPQASGPQRTASDVGVTESTIKIGVPIFDLGALAAYGVETESDGLEEQKLMMTAIVDWHNANGGVNGRTIELAFAQYNPLDMDDMRAACQKLAEDDKVFAVMAQAFWGPAVLCMTERFGLPLLVDDGASDEFYRRSNGLLFSTQQGKARAIRNQIWMLHEMGILEGKKIGALISDLSGDGEAPTEALEPTLELYGYELTHEARVTSIEAMPSEIAIGVQQMKAKGVDFIIATQTSTLWNDEAERQEYRPKYSTSDFSQKTRDSSVDDHGEHWDGTIGITGTLWADRGANVPETAATRYCLDRAAEHGSGPYERGDFVYDVQIGVCNVVDTMVRGLTAAGVNPTRLGLSSSIQGLGQLDLANMNIASFRPGKFDAPDTVRPTVWHFDCLCYKPTGPFRPTAH